MNNSAQQLDTHAAMGSDEDDIIQAPEQHSSTAWWQRTGTCIPIQCVLTAWHQLTDCCG